MQGDELHYDDIARKICGFPVEGSVPRELVRKLVHEDDLERVSALSTAALDPSRRERAIYICRIVRASDQKLRWVRATGTAKFGNGQPTHYLGTVQDITDEIEAEERIRASEARLRMAIDAAGLAVWELDTASGEVTPSPELNRLLGFPPEARPNLEELRSRYAPGERERIVAEGEAIRAAGGDRIETSARFLMPNGSERHLLIRAQVAPGSEGLRPRVIGIFTDVTEVKQREERLKLLNRELHHRLFNLVGVISSVANFSLTNEEERERFTGRLRAMSHGIRASLNGGTSAAQIAILLQEILEPFEITKGRCVLDGPPVHLSARSAGACALAFFELMTNAIKYGALRDPNGKIAVRWAAKGERAKIEWREELVTPLDPPKSQGFGSQLITKLLFHPPDAASLEFTPTGIRCEMDVTTDV